MFMIIFLAVDITGPLFNSFVSYADLQPKYYLPPPLPREVKNSFSFRPHGYNHRNSLKSFSSFMGLERLYSTTRHNHLPSHDF